MAVVREDHKGIFVIAGGYAARPGDVVGYAHACEMSDLGLSIGNKVKARHIGGSPLIKVVTQDGRTAHWHNDPDYDPIAGWNYSDPPEGP